MSKAKAKTYTAEQKRDRKRLEQERERDLADIAGWYLRGWSRQSMLDEIARTRPYVLSLTTIKRDLRELEKRWFESQMIDFNEAKSRELQRLDALIEEYWVAWENSKNDAEEIMRENISDKQTSTGGEVQTTKDGTVIESTPSSSTFERNKVNVRTKGRDGNPRFLEGIERCIVRRCEILGLNAATKIEIDHNWRKQAEKAGIATVANAQFEEMISTFSQAIERESEE